jgi:hypothetical protein
MNANVGLQRAERGFEEKLAEQNVSLMPFDDRNRMQ